MDPIICCNISLIIKGNIYKSRKKIIIFYVKNYFFSDFSFLICLAFTFDYIIKMESLHKIYPLILIFILRYRKLKIMKEQILE